MRTDRGVIAHTPWAGAGRRRAQGQAVELVGVEKLGRRALDVGYVGDSAIGLRRTWAAGP